MPNALASSVTGSPVAAKPAQLVLALGVSLGGLVAGSRRARRESRCRAAFAAEFQFEFGQGGHDRRDGPTGRGGGVDAFADGAQQNSPLTKVSDGAGHLRDRTPQAVDRGDDHGVAFAGVVEQRGQAGSMGAGSSGEGVGEDPGRVDPGGVQGVALDVEVRRRY